MKYSSQCDPPPAAFAAVTYVKAVERVLGLLLFTANGQRQTEQF